MSTSRRLAAILAADVVGYSRLIELDETGTLAALRERRKSVMLPAVATHRGRNVKVMGDGGACQRSERRELRYRIAETVRRGQCWHCQSQAH